MIAKALTSTIAGMIQFIDASRDQPNQIQIQTVADLRLYCYAVAGIVGELLTDIFVLHHPLGLVEYQELRRLSVGFGEFLQLINILKDSTQDASDGRVFIPCEVSREHVQELALAGQQDAVMYIRLLERPISRGMCWPTAVSSFFSPIGLSSDCGRRCWEQSVP